MNDTTVSKAQAIQFGEARWLLLITQLPAKPDYLRVKLRRRIQRIGAVALRSAVYALPNRDDAMEDFAWLRTELLADGGDAVLCATTLIAGVTDADLEEMFRAVRDADYRELAEAARAAVADAAGEALVREVPRLRRRLEQVGKVDFFGSAGRADAERAIAAAAELAAGPAGLSPASGARSDQPGPAAGQGRTWVTRSGVFVDRIASAWLIRRFIDPGATFKFVSATGYEPLPGEARFDMYQAEYTHEGDRCTFETLLARFGIDDPALHALGEIVHDIDCKDARFERPEAAGVESILAGLVRAELDDTTRIARGAAVMEALYAQLGGSP
jgi:hypothetical protein